jgi:hypothetical protein
MKTFTAVILFFGFYFTSFAQDITGLWYSRDSSRLYKVCRTDSSYQANLYLSKRTKDTPGVLVLRDVKYYQKKQEYEGIIHAVDDGMATSVKIRVTGNGKILRMKLHRMFFMPVYIQWYKAE